MNTLDVKNTRNIEMSTNVGTGGVETDNGTDRPRYYTSGELGAGRDAPRTFEIGHATRAYITASRAMSHTQNTKTCLHGQNSTFLRPASPKNKTRVIKRGGKMVLAWGWGCFWLLVVGCFLLLLTQARPALAVLWAFLSTGAIFI